MKKILRLFCLFFLSNITLLGQNPTTTFRVILDSLPDASMQSTYFATAHNNTNQVVISANRRVVFSVYLKNTSDSSIEFSGGLIHFNFNKEVLNGGTGTLNLEASSLPGTVPGTGLWLKNPVVNVSGTQGRLQTSSNTLPGAGSGFVIAAGDSILWHRFKLVTSAPTGFAQTSLDLTVRTIFNSASPQTKIGAYINSVNTNIENLTTFIDAFNPWGWHSPVMYLLTPNGGEVFKANAIDTIKWFSRNIENIGIYYSTNNGTDWVTISSSTASWGERFLWRVPNLASNTCRVKIVDLSNPSNQSSSANVFTIVDPGMQLQIISLVEGMYDEQTGVYLPDTLQVNLFSKDALLLVDSAKIFPDSNGTAMITFQEAPAGEYYIVMKHRNALETWSKPGGENFSIGGLTTYNFSTDSANAYGANQVKIGSKWYLYSGDVNHDQIIDFTDLLLVDNASTIFSFGYSITDCNGDGVTDFSDLLIVNSNADQYISVRRP